MHELAVCQSLLREVERAAQAHGSSEVATVEIAIGPLSGVEPALLARAFEFARLGTLAARAALAIEATPVSVWCGRCEHASTVAANALLCARCGGWQVQLRSGDELLLKRVQLMPAAPQEREPCANSAAVR